MIMNILINAPPMLIPPMVQQPARATMQENMNRDATIYFTTSDLVTLTAKELSGLCYLNSESALSPFIGVKIGCGGVGLLLGETAGGGVGGGVTPGLSAKVYGLAFLIKVMY
jgi:hypothetical protein